MDRSNTMMTQLQGSRPNRNSILDLHIYSHMTSIFKLYQFFWLKNKYLG